MLLQAHLQHIGQRCASTLYANQCNSLLIVQSHGTPRADTNTPVLLRKLFCVLTIRKVSTVDCSTVATVMDNLKIRVVRIPIAYGHIDGMLQLPDHAVGVVLFAHGSGSSRHSPRNNFVAQVLRSSGIGTLLMDLLTRSEDVHYPTRFDIELLTQRILSTMCWLQSDLLCRQLPLGYFGASAGAAALQAAARLRSVVGAVVSRGGRTDLADEHDLARCVVQLCCWLAATAKKWSSSTVLHTPA